MWLGSPRGQWRIRSTGATAFTTSRIEIASGLNARVWPPPGPGRDRSGKPFYEPYAAQELLRQVEPELGIEMVPFKEMVYVQERAQYVARDEVEPGETVLDISGTEFRRRLQAGIGVPEWLLPIDDTHFRVTVAPAIGPRGLQRLRGCLDDAVVDRVTGSFVSIADVPAA